MSSTALQRTAAPAARLALHTPADRPPCRHCDSASRLHRRGLCRPCYDDKRIRRQYPSVHPRGHRFARQDTPEGGRLPMPERPTKAQPGSLAKVAVMERRALANRSVFHPRDPKLSDPEVEIPWYDDAKVEDPDLYTPDPVWPRWVGWPRRLTSAPPEK